MPAVIQGPYIRWAAAGPGFPTCHTQAAGFQCRGSIRWATAFPGCRTGRLRCRSRLRSALPAASWAGALMAAPCGGRPHNRWEAARTERLAHADSGFYISSVAVHMLHECHLHTQAPSWQQQQQPAATLDRQHLQRQVSARHPASLQPAHEPPHQQHAQHSAPKLLADAEQQQTQQLQQQQQQRPDGRQAAAAPGRGGPQRRSPLSNGTMLPPEPP